MRKYIEVPVLVLVGISLLLMSLVGVHIYEKTSRTYVPATILVKGAIASVVVIECNAPSKKELLVLVTAGFVASEHGHIITAAHGLSNCTADNERNIVVRFWQDPSRPHRAKLLKIDAERDVALLQVPTTPSDIRPLGVDPTVQAQGARTVAIGHPQFFYWSVSDGIVSADRLFRKPIRHLTQVSTPITQGNSGGPILNEAGLVIGIASFIVGGNPTLSFIVPADVIVQFAQEIYF